MLIPLSSYEDYLRSLNYAENTIISYKSDLTGFDSWLTLKGKTAINAIHPADINDYVLELKKSKYSPSTISRKLISLRRFFFWAVQNNLAYIDPTGNIEIPKVMKEGPNIVTKTEINKLLKYCDKKNPKCLRDKAMLLVLICTGLRISELLELDVSDFDKERRCLIIKQRKYSRIELDRKVFSALKKYTEESRPLLFTKDENTEKLFLSLRGSRLSRQGFWKNLKNLAKKAKLNDDFTPEMIRHNFGVNALMKGQSIKEVQLMLGHKTLSSVNDYAFLASKLKRDY